MRIVNRNYDIPYIAGYSQDGRTVFIDRHLPRTFRWLMKTVRVEPFLMTHEIVEKALLDELRLHYLHAHQIAVRIERDAVKAAGVSWWAYQRFMKQHEKVIEEERLIRVPATLDLTPYRDEHDFRYRRGHIQILDRPALEELSCECYAIVRGYTDKVFPPSEGA